MDKDRVKGAAKKVEGRVQKAAGDLTGNSDQKLKGSMKEVEDTAQEKLGKAKDQVKKATR